MTAITPINPHLVNLHVLVPDYLKGTYPLFADAHHLPIPVATNLCNDGIDMVLLSFVHDTTQMPLSPSTRNSPATAPNKTYHTHLAQMRLDTKTLSHLPKKSTDNPLMPTLIGTLSRIHHLPIHTVATIFWHIWGMCHYYVHQIAKDTKLSQQELTDWLQLQVLFYDATLTNQAQTLGITLPPVQSTHSAYQYKLNKKAAVFDTADIRLPNHQWLLDIAEHTSHQTGLRIGSICRPKPLMPNLIIRATYQLSHLFNIQKVGVIAIIILIVILIGYGLHTPSPKPQTEPTKIKETPIQDVAIIRIDDGQIDNKANEANEANKEKAP